MANDIVAIAASMKIIVFISIDEKTTDGLHLTLKIALSGASAKVKPPNRLFWARPKVR